MATMLYINPADDGTRATELGCGWMPTVPAGYDATPPCVILNGAGQTVILPDDNLTHADVYKAAPVENVVSYPTVTVDPDALTNAATAITNATTVKAMGKAIAAALDLLNPNTV